MKLLKSLKTHLDTLGLWFRNATKGQDPTPLEKTLEALRKKEFYKKYRPPAGKKETKNKKSNKGRGAAVIILAITSLLSLIGCSKSQDVKIVHNYFDKLPSYQEQKNKMVMDLCICKEYDSLKKNAIIYKL